MGSQTWLGRNPVSYWRSPRCSCSFRSHPQPALAHAQFCCACVRVRAHAFSSVENKLPAWAQKVSEVLRTQLIYLVHLSSSNIWLSCRALSRPTIISSPPPTRKTFSNLFSSLYSSKSDVNFYSIHFSSILPSSPSRIAHSININTCLSTHAYRYRPQRAVVCWVQHWDVELRACMCVCVCTACLCMRTFVCCARNNIQVDKNNMDLYSQLSIWQSEWVNKRKETDKHYKGKRQRWRKTK